MLATKGSLFPLSMRTLKKMESKYAICSVVTLMKLKTDFHFPTATTALNSLVVCRKSKTYTTELPTRSTCTSDVKSRPADRA